MRPRPDSRGLLARVALSTPLLLLLLLLLTPPIPLLGHLWAAGTPTPAPGAQQDGTLSMGRVKRGWVWNQFFVVEEYTGTEPLYVGKVKWDPAPAIPRPGPRRYPLVGARAPDPLTSYIPVSGASSQLSPAWGRHQGPELHSRSCPRPCSSPSPFRIFEQRLLAGKSSHLVARCI